MSMQYGAVKYIPSSSNGNWTSLCQIAAQARSVGYGAGRPDSLTGKDIPNFTFLRQLWEGAVKVPGIGALYNNTQTTYSTDFMNKPASYMAGTKYFDAASKWYPSLQQDASGTTNTDFLNNYFVSAMQTKLGLTSTGAVEWSTALSGTNVIAANTQILEKSSTYFVSTTHAMYYLQLAEEAIAKNDTNAAKNHFDSIAAVYFGCGDTNPVPLPIYTPDTVVTTAPQVSTQITWTKDTAQKSGDGGTVYSLYNLANKRASNYGKCGSLGTGSCSTDKVAQSTSGSASVADLNLVVADALNYGTSAPTTTRVTNIRDSINTINAQAAQRYIARVSLDANLPGNGMGGSTQSIVVKNPAASAASNALNAANGKIPAACGGGLYTLANAAGGNPAAATFPPPSGTSPGSAGTLNSGKNVAKVPTGQTTALYTAAGAAGPIVNAQCGTTANSTGTVASNTALVRSVMNVVSMTQPGTAGSAPYTLEGSVLGAGAAGGVVPGSVGGVSPNAVKAATRGQATFNAAADYKKLTPIGCVDKSVAFSDLSVTVGGLGTANANGYPLTAASTGKKMIYKFCDPQGYPGVSVATNTLAENKVLYAMAAGAGAPTGGGGAAGYFQQVFGGAGGANNVPANAAAITAITAGTIQKVWDPIMVAQLTDGAMCCDAGYYSTAGVGRPAITLLTTTNAIPITGYNPPLAGGDMVSEVSPGGMCPAHSSTNGYDEDTVGSAAQTNPAMVELLEGQAFYASLAPSQYSLPTTSTTATTQTAREAKQKQCATHITSMMKLNKATAVAAAADKFAYSYSAVNFPLWKVGIGGGTTPTQYTVPNGYCYANACFDDFAKVGTQSTFKGAEKLGALVKGPNMAEVKTGEACGLANTACAAAPATWNGGPAVMATCYGSDCTTGGILNTTGAIPVA